MHPMLPMPLSLFRGLHNLSNLAKAIIIYIHLYPFITLSSVVFDIIELRVTSHHGFSLQPSLGPANSSPMASQILSKYERHPTTRMPSAIHSYLLSPLLRNGYSVPSTQLPSRPEVCIRISICDVGVMRSMKKMLSKHLRPTAMPHPQTQLPLLVAYFGGSFFLKIQS